MSFPGQALTVGGSANNSGFAGFSADPMAYRSNDFYFAASRVSPTKSRKRRKSDAILADDLPKRS
jgi:hypothetical protein